MTIESKHDFGYGSEEKELKKKIQKLEQMIDSRYKILDKYLMNMNERLSKIEKKIDVVFQPSIEEIKDLIEEMANLPACEDHKNE